MAILADTNILLRLTEPSDPDYQIVRGAVEALARDGEDICYSSQNLVEFWNVCTRPAKHNGFGLSNSDTNALAKIIEARFQLLFDNEKIQAEWRRLVVDHGVSGSQVHDARLAASMLVHGVAKILTLNDRDFVRYSGLVVVHPRELVAL